MPKFAPLYARIQAFTAELLDAETGQGLTEYALMLSLVAVVAIAALALFGGKVTTVLSSVARSV